ncbi:hypothetical protein ACWC2T_33860 [Streptomyces sp. NPDC001393]
MKPGTASNVSSTPAISFASPPGWRRFCWARRRRIEDANRKQPGKRYYSSPYQQISGDFWTSDLVPIDGPGYSYSMPHVYLSWAHGVLHFPPFVYPKCLTNHDFHGNYHNFGSGYSDSSHPSERC